MSTKYKLLILFSAFLVSITSCKKNSQTVSEPDDRNDTVEDIISISDFGTGVLNFTPVYEKVIAPDNYKHFSQSSSTTLPTKVCLPTSYMIGKGLFRNITVNNATLQPIITGMKTDNSGTSTIDGYNYAKNDLGATCTDLYLSTSASNTFDKIYNWIKDGYPIISLVNIKRANNSYTIEPNYPSIRHYVVIVGIAVKSFSERTGVVKFIDPLTKINSQGFGTIKEEDLATFIKSTFTASAAQKSNLIRIGCASDAINNNLIIKNGPVIGFPNGAGSCAEFYPYGEGGVPPYQYSMNNSTWQNSNMFLICYTGQYAFRVKDATGTIAVLNRTF